MRIFCRIFLQIETFRVAYFLVFLFFESLSISLETRKICFGLFFLLFYGSQLLFSLCFKSSFPNTKHNLLFENHKKMDFFRLSYHQRVVDSVPGSFRGFAPDKPDPTFKYEALPETENNMTCMISAKLVNAIKAKCAPEEIQAILKEVPDDEGSDQATCLRVRPDSFFVHNFFIYFLFFLQNSIFVQTLLNMGNKSFSHSFAAIAKFHPTLKVSCIYIINPQPEFVCPHGYLRNPLTYDREILHA